jgi:hypothetical protein
LSHDDEQDVPPSPHRPEPYQHHLPLSSEEILSLGLKLVGFQVFRQGVCDDLKQRRFRAFFGIGPTALAALFADLALRIDAKQD